MSLHKPRSLEAENNNTGHNLINFFYLYATLSAR